MMEAQVFNREAVLGLPIDDVVNELSTDDEDEKVTDSHFKAKDIGLKAQKKILGKMTSKSIAKVFIDDTTGSALDCLYKMAKEYSSSTNSSGKKDAEKVMKYLIKTVIKVGILYRNNQLNQEELRVAEQFRKKFQSACMTVVSFYEVDFSFDKHYLSKVLLELSAMITLVIKRHLTQKSLDRSDHVFQYFAKPDFLEAVFKKDGPHRVNLATLVAELNKMMDNGTL